MLAVRVRGAVELRACASELRHEADLLERHVVEAAEAATKNVPRLIAAAAPRFLPNRYAAAMGPSLRSKTTTRLGRDAGVSIRVWATGKHDQRDVSRINAGLLRHPLFGNRRHWYAQPVKRGFVTEPFKAERGHIVNEIDRALDEIRERIERG